LLCFKKKHQVWVKVGHHPLRETRPTTSLLPLSLLSSRRSILSFYLLSFLKLQLAKMHSTAWCRLVQATAAAAATIMRSAAGTSLSLSLCLSLCLSLSLSFSVFLSSHLAKFATRPFSRRRTKTVHRRVQRRSSSSHVLTCSSRLFRSKSI
jgi:hypothetical protein